MNINESMTATLFQVDPITNNIIGMIERDPLWEAFNSPEAVVEFETAISEWVGRIIIDSLKGKTWEE